MEQDAKRMPQLMAEAPSLKELGALSVGEEEKNHAVGSGGRE